MKKGGIRMNERTEKLMNIAKEAFDSKANEKGLGYSIMALIELLDYKF